MTTSLEERQKLAAMGNTLRPDWPAGSLLTFITQELKNRTAREIAIALAYISWDPEIRTPGVLREAGPWWEAARPIAAPVGRGRGRCENCDGFHSPQSPCQVVNLHAHRRKRGAALARAELAAHGIGRATPTTEEEPNAQDS